MHAHNNNYYYYSTCKASYVCKRNYAVSTLISPPPISKYKFEASNIPHFLLACLLHVFFRLHVKCTCIYSVERNLDDNHSRNYNGKQHHIRTRQTILETNDLRFVYPDGRFLRMEMGEFQYIHKYAWIRLVTAVYFYKHKPFFRSKPVFLRLQFNICNHPNSNKAQCMSTSLLLCTLPF